MSTAWSTMYMITTMMTDTQENTTNLVMFLPDEKGITSGGMVSDIWILQVVVLSAG